MRLTVIGTGSAGNCYAVHGDDGSVFLLDAGIPTRRVTAALGDDLRRVVGCFVTHEHKDHSRAMTDLAARGIDVYASAGTMRKMGVDNGLLRRFKAVCAGSIIRAGEFTAVVFETKHDAEEPVGCLFRYEPTGETALYATDTFYLPNRFPSVNYWLVECNFVDELAIQQADDGVISPELMIRLRTSHMSLRRLKEAFAANDLRATSKIVLLHLSDQRSDERRMTREITEQTGIETVAASEGEVISLTLTPF